MELLVPVIETEYLPAVELEHDSVAVPGEGGKETLVGVEDFEKPFSAWVQTSRRVVLDVDIRVQSLRRANYPGLGVYAYE